MWTKEELMEMLEEYVSKDYNDNLIEYALVNGRNKEAKELEEERDNILKAIQNFNRENELRYKIIEILVSYQDEIQYQEEDIKNLKKLETELGKIVSMNEKKGGKNE